LSWLAVAFGLFTRRVENASYLPLVVLILPVVSSGFVPVDSFPGWLQPFARHQPFTPIIDTIRGLLVGAPISSDAAWAAGWLLAIAIVGYVWSMSLYRRRVTSH
jgi:ABC-2 type transport system permease protein